MTSQDQYYQPLELIAWQSRVATAATIFDTGNQQAKLMIIGESFVDRAEQLLTAMIKAMGYQREDVSIVQLPENCDPPTEEAATCTSFLNQQIDLIKPRLLLAVGRGDLVVR